MRTLIMVTRIGVDVENEYAENWGNGNFDNSNTTQNGDRFTVSGGDTTLLVLNGASFSMSPFTNTLYTSQKEPGKRLVCALCKLIDNSDNSTEIVIAIHWHGVRSQSRYKSFFGQILDLDDFDCNSLDCRELLNRELIDIVPYTIGASLSHGSIKNQVDVMIASLKSDTGFEAAFNGLWDTLYTKRKIEQKLLNLVHIFLPLYIDLKGIFEISTEDPRKAAEYLEEVVRYHNAYDGSVSFQSKFLQGAQNDLTALAEAVMPAKYEALIKISVGQLKTLFGLKEGQEQKNSPTFQFFKALDSLKTRKITEDNVKEVINFFKELKMESGYSPCKSEDQKGWDPYGTGEVCIQSFDDWFREFKEILKKIQEKVFSASR